jgi:hypothetical protein
VYLWVCGWQANVIQKLPVKTNSAVKASLVTDLDLGKSSKDGAGMVMEEGSTNVSIEAQAPVPPQAGEKSPLSTLIRSKVG